MKTKIRARKKTVMKWIEGKFGSLAMVAAAVGLDTTTPGVQALLNDVVKSRDPVTLSIGWRSHVIAVLIEHHKTPLVTKMEGDTNYVSELTAADLVDE